MAKPFKQVVQVCAGTPASGPQRKTGRTLVHAHCTTAPLSRRAISASGSPCHTYAIVCLATTANRFAFAPMGGLKHRVCGIPAGSRGTDWRSAFEGTHLQPVTRRIMAFERRTRPNRVICLNFTPTSPHAFLPIAPKPCSRFLVERYIADGQPVGARALCPSFPAWSCPLRPSAT